MKRRTVIGFVFFLLGLAVVILAFSQLQLSALPEPGKLESLVATQVKHLIIYRDSRNGIPPTPGNKQASLDEGDTLYGTDCSMRHGSDGHTLTDNGRWMYPRASELTSPEVQKYSDREPFWIIKNGIRLSGMPAFGKVESDEHI